jgi:uncharacterized protein YeaO (DUF488 family)
MPISIVRLGQPRTPNEGLRIGTVRRPPRGVPKTDFSRLNFYDVWLPQLAPSLKLLTTAKDSTTLQRWTIFAKKYRAEMNRPEARRILELLAALSHQTNLSVGCYCEDPNRCHRTILGTLLQQAGAKIKEFG